MTENNINWGIIGCGAVTEIKSGPAYQKVEGFQLQAVMRRTRAMAEDFALRHGVPQFFDNADALINDPGIDAVYIATPPDSHKFYGLKVAAAGKPCCIEKPLAPTLDDSQAIVDAFKVANIPLYVAYYRRSLPRFNKIKELIVQGSLGSLRHIQWHLSSPANAKELAGAYDWHTDPMIARAGHFDDLACHGLDLFAYLFGDISEVRGVVKNQQGLYRAADAVSACWSHSNGMTGTGSWNFGAFARNDEVVLYGSAGELRFSIFAEKPIILLTSEGETQFSIEHPENIQLHHVQNMCDALLHGASHPSTGDSAHHTSWVIEEILNTPTDF